MVKFHPCACPPANMKRLHRAPWMRLLFPSRALYECGSCGTRFLASEAAETELRMRSQAERLSSFLATDHGEGPGKQKAG